MGAVELVLMAVFAVAIVDECEGDFAVGNDAVVPTVVVASMVGA